MIDLLASICGRTTDAGSAREALERRARMLRSDAGQGTAARVGARAIGSYLDSVTRTVAKGRTNAGTKRLREYEVNSGADGIEGKVALTPGMKLQEFGGIIRARNVRYLSIPLDAVRRHDKLALWRHEELVPSLSQEGSLDDHSND